MLNINLTNKCNKKLIANMLKIKLINKLIKKII